MKKIACTILAFVVLACTLLPQEPLPSPTNGGGAGGGGAVSSVFGRTGGVVATQDDYGPTQFNCLSATRTSATRLTFGANLSAALPCNIDYITNGSHVVVPFTVAVTCDDTTATNPSTLRLTMDSTGALKANWSAAAGLACTGATVANNISSVPTGELLLHTWVSSTVTGQWNATGTDNRAIYTGVAPITCAVGCTISGGAITNTAVSPSGADPLDATVYSFVDEFADFNTNFGAPPHTWDSFGATLTASAGTSTTDHIGVDLLTTGTLSGNGGVLLYTNPSTVSIMGDSFSGSNFRPFTMKATFAIDNLTTVAFRVGFTSATGQTPANFIGIRFDTASGDTAAGGAVCEVINATTSTTSALANALTALSGNTNWISVKISATATGTVTCALATDNGAYTTNTVTATFPSNLPYPYFGMWTNTTGARAMSIDRFAMVFTGLHRP